MGWPGDPEKIRRRVQREAAILWGLCVVCGLVVCVCVALLLSGCGGSRYTPDDTTANTIAVREEVRVYELCSGDAGDCLPSRIRALTLLSACANARELAAHGEPLPDAGVLASCQPK